MYRLRVPGEVVEVCLEEPESLVKVSALALAIMRGIRELSDQQSRVHRFLAQVEYELLQRHGLVVHADEEVA